MKRKAFNFNIVILCFYLVTLLFPLLTINNVSFYSFNFKNPSYAFPILIGDLMGILSLVLAIFNKKQTNIIGFILVLFAIFILSFSTELIHNIFGIGRSNMSLDNVIIVKIVCLAINGFVSLKEISSNNSFLVKDIVEIGIFVAIALILDLPVFKIHIGQNGGSISLVMLPLFLLSLRRSFMKSFIACGLTFGLLNCLIDPYGFISFPFDYFLAFGSIAIVSIFRKHILQNNIKGFLFFTLSLLLVFISRTFWHTISGLIFYQPITFLESLTYQLLYLVPSFAAIFVIFIFLYKPICLMNKKVNR